MLYRDDTVVISTIVFVFFIFHFYTFIYLCIHLCICIPFFAVSPAKNVFNGTLVSLSCNVIDADIFNHFLWIYLRTGDIVSNESVYQFTSTVFTGGEYQCLAYNDSGCNQTDTTTVNSM